MKQENRLVDQERNLHSYRFFGEAAEALGRRLDAARDILAQTENKWAKQYWQNVINQLVFQWRSLPALHDGDAQMSIIPRWTVDYKYYERDDGVGHGLSDRMFDRLFREPDLQGSWDRVREQRLAKAQF